MKRTVTAKYFAVDALVQKSMQECKDCFMFNVIRRFGYVHDPTVSEPGIKCKQNESYLYCPLIGTMLPWAKSLEEVYLEAEYDEDYNLILGEEGDDGGKVRS